MSMQVKLFGLNGSIFSITHKGDVWSSKCVEFAELLEYSMEKVCKRSGVKNILITFVDEDNLNYYIKNLCINTDGTHSHGVLVGKEPSEHGNPKIFGNNKAGLSELVACVCDDLGATDSDRDVAIIRFEEKWDNMYGEHKSAGCLWTILILGLVGLMCFWHLH